MRGEGVGGRESAHTASISLLRRCQRRADKKRHFCSHCGSAVKCLKIITCVILRVLAEGFAIGTVFDRLHPRCFNAVIPLNLNPSLPPPPSTAHLLALADEYSEDCSRTKFSLKSYAPSYSNHNQYLLHHSEIAISVSWQPILYALSPHDPDMGSTETHQ